MKRGEIWWARLPPPTGRRPVALVSRDAAYAIISLSRPALAALDAALQFSLGLR